MKLRYTRRAAAELDAILTYITEKSPQGARKVQERIQSLMLLLLRYPHAGQPLQQRGLRRMAVTPYPYLIFYRATDEAIIIHGVRHSSRRSSTVPS